MLDINNNEIKIGDWVQGFTSFNAFIIGCVTAINDNGTVVVSCDMFDGTHLDFTLDAEIEFLA